MIELDRSSNTNDYCIFGTFVSAVLNSVEKCLKQVSPDVSVADSADENVLELCNETHVQDMLHFYEPMDDFHYSFLPYVQTVDMEKPQIHFADTVSTDCKCFLPHLKEKHNAKAEFRCERCSVSLSLRVAYDTLPSMFLLEDFSRQIGMDLQNNELHGYLSPYAYEINRMTNWFA